MFIAISLVSLSFTAHSKDVESITLLTNVNVFDGVADKLVQEADILIYDNLIKQIAKDIQVPDGARVIDASGKTIIPGLIDAHWHMTMAKIPLSVIVFGDMSDDAICGALASEPTLT